MKTFLICLLVVIALPNIASAGDKERLAEKATLEWLAQLDAAAYQESWERAASLFKKQVSAKRWKDAASGVREPLGQVKSRKLIHETYTTTLPGAPDGEYVVFQYQTEFENKQTAIETVTPMLDGHEWRVSGYFVR